jgi:phage portal protein BeeE
VSRLGDAVGRQVEALGRTKALDTDTGAFRRWAASSRRNVVAGQPVFQPWSADRAVKEGSERDIWVFRAMHQWALAIANLPVVLRDGDPVTGKLLESDSDPLVGLLNEKPASALYPSGSLFRYRLAWQLGISKAGVFVERVVNQGGRLIGLHLLPPDLTRPLPDAFGRLAAYRVTLPGGYDHIDLPVENVCWIRWPHPTDPWSGMTPFEALGITIDTDVALHLYNRRFLARDGRPAGLVVINSETTDGDLDELERRFSGMGATGEIAFIESPPDVQGRGGGITWQDFGTKPRDMAYTQLSKNAKDEILTGIGTPESVAGNASGRTFDNADAEEEGFHKNNVLPNLQLILSALSSWTADGPDGSHCLGVDTSSIAVLGRDQREREQWLVSLYLAQVITRTELREKLGYDALEPEYNADLYNGGAPTTNAASQTTTTPVSGAQETPDQGPPGEAPQLVAAAPQPPRLPRVPEIRAPAAGGSQKHDERFEVVDFGGMKVDDLLKAGADLTAKVKKERQRWAAPV